MKSRCLLKGLLEVRHSIPDLRWLRARLERVKGHGPDEANAAVGPSVSFEPRDAGAFDISHDESISGINGAALTHGGQVIVFYHDWPSGEDDYQWGLFLDAVERHVDHELAHAEQVSRSQGMVKPADPSDSWAYLSSSTEIYAFARTAVRELRQLGYDDDAIKVLLRSPKGGNGPAPGESHAFWVYYDRFGPKDPVFQRFAKEMTQMLECQLLRLLESDLGDGYHLANTAKGVYRIMSAAGEDAGSLLVVEVSPIPYVRDVLVYDEHRGKGLYRRVLLALKAKYGKIRSDDAGAISDDAESAWRKVGARSVLNTDPVKIYGGSWFVLE